MNVRARRRTTGLNIVRVAAIESLIRLNSNNSGKVIESGNAAIPVPAQPLLVRSTSICACAEGK